MSTVILLDDVHNLSVKPDDELGRRASPEVGGGAGGAFFCGVGLRGRGGVQTARRRAGREKENRHKGSRVRLASARLPWALPGSKGNLGRDDPEWILSLLSEPAADA